MKITAIRTIIPWDNGKMVVLNPGDTGELSDKLAKPEIDAGNASRDDGASVFTVTDKKFGKYEITGPGLDEPLVVTGGKKALQAQLAELNAELARSMDATSDDDDGAPAE